MRRIPAQQTAARGFSLVEVTVAIGIFAFVAIGILGLLPAALRLRADSAQDTMAALIAQQLFASVDAAQSFSNVIVPTGTYVGNPATATNNLLSGPTVMGYLTGTSLPFWHYFQNPGASWTNSGASESQVVESARNDIMTMARLSVVTNIPNAPPKLALVTVEVRSPVSLALSNSRVATFTTLRALK
jgi:Tfp pilus assembly protein PilV